MEFQKYDCIIQKIFVEKKVYFIRIHTRRYIQSAILDKKYIDASSNCNNFHLINRIEEILYGLYHFLLK